MTNPLFVDATTPFLRSDDGNTILLKTTSSDTWFHAPTSARMARGPGGRYLLNLMRSRRHGKFGSKPDGLVTTGGILAAQVDLVALAATPAQEETWTEILERHGHSSPPGSMFAFVPLSLWKGRMTVGGVDSLVEDPAAYRETVIGTPTSMPVTLRLNPHGADVFRDAIEARSGPPVALRFDYEYDAAAPPAAYRITADALATHAVVARHPAAAYYGAPARQAELDAMSDELRDVGAVVITWTRPPDGFDTPRVAAMERAILQRWIKNALDRLVESVEPDDDDACAGGSGGVVVRLKATGDIGDVDLSERHDGERFTRESFSYSINLKRLRGLRPAAYATDIIENDASLPVLLNFGQDSRVRRYVSLAGYRRSDGTVASRSHEASGLDGLSVSDVVRWDAGQPRPATVEISYSIEWADSAWEGHSGKAVLETDVPCIAFSVIPGRRIAELALICDLALAERGALGAVTWSTELPPNDGVHPKNYSGSFFIGGMGTEGSVFRRIVAFPFQEGRESSSFFKCTAELVLPDGMVLSRSKLFSLADSMEDGIFLADLRPT